MKTTSINALVMIVLKSLFIDKMIFSLYLKTISYILRTIQGIKKCFIKCLYKNFITAISLFVYVNNF